MRVAHETPVHKKGASSSIKNYRPISLTLVICKMFELIVKKQMLEYLCKHDLITKPQHGFLSQHSTTKVRKQMQWLRTDAKCKFVWLRFGLTLNYVQHI